MNRIRQKKGGGGKEEIKIRTEVNELENDYSTGRLNHAKSGWFGKTNKNKQISGKSCQRKKREK